MNRPLAMGTRFIDIILVLILRFAIVGCGDFLAQGNVSLGDDEFFLQGNLLISLFAGVPNVHIFMMIRNVCACSRTAVCCIALGKLRLIIERSCCPLRIIM